MTVTRSRPTPRRAPLWRSLLYVPAHVERFVAKAHTRGADAIQLDLEDSVPASEKETARLAVPEAAELVSRAGADVVVRINRPWRLALRDLEAAVSPRVAALALPKVDSPDQVRLVDEVVADLEEERGMAVGHTQLLVIVETAAGFLRTDEIARACPRVAALTLGSEDFALDLGTAPEPEVLAYPKQHIVIAARAAGIAPLGLVGSTAGFADIEGFREVVRSSRRLGYEGASAIHPAQVPVLNEEFSPTEEEVDRARRVVVAYEQAVSGGRGAVDLDGQMIDAPVVARAERLLDLHQRLHERSGP
ncbi:MAG: CoA ester lyase [Streptosporangiales bacterium]|nr:CoA ester lyase [Streptosporangiales bacterium]